MTDQYSAPGGEPTVPLVPASGYSQPAVPPLEHTAIEPFAGEGGYPDFSYGSIPYGDSLPTLGEPLSAPPAQTGPVPQHPASNYSQPYPQSGYAEPLRQAQPTSGGNPYPPRPVADYADPYRSDRVAPADPYQSARLAPVHSNQYAQYQPYPVPAATPLRDPVAYDYGYARPVTSSEHPNAVPALVLGLVGLFFMPLLCPVGWFLAARGRREVAENPGRWSSTSTLTAGLVIGIIGTVAWGLFLAAFLGLMMLAFVGAAM